MRRVEVLQKTNLELRCLTRFIVPTLFGLTLLGSAVTPTHAQAVIGTYAQTPVMVADGTTIYTALAYADNTGLIGESTWGTQHSFFLPPYASLIPGGLGVAYGKPTPDRDFFSGNAMAFEFFSGPTLATGRLVNPGDLVSNTVGDLQFYRFTINTNAPLGMGNFDLGPDTGLTNAAGSPQSFIKHNATFTVTALAGDLTADGFVGIEDLNTVLGNWNASADLPDAPAGDVNGDGFVGIEDLNWVLANWNTGAPPAAPGVTVPEPATAILLAAACVASIKRRF
jgi:hypothetical protein